MAEREPLSLEIPLAEDSARLMDIVADELGPSPLETLERLIQTFGIFAAGYLVRPLGGIVLAHFGDMFGRKKVFAFSILLMAC